jgi:hypothetical protein
VCAIVPPWTSTIVQVRCLNGESVTLRVRCTIRNFGF